MDFGDGNKKPVVPPKPFPRSRSATVGSNFFFKLDQSTLLAHRKKMVPTLSENQARVVEDTSASSQVSNVFFREKIRAS